MHFRMPLILAFVLLSLAGFSSDTLHFKKNLRIYPIMEGASFGYEQMVGNQLGKCHSVKGNVNFRQNKVTSWYNDLEKYREISLQADYRRYLNRKVKTMEGKYIGIFFLLSHIEGEMADPSAQVQEIINIWSRSISVGYNVGVQKMYPGGFNIDLGCSIRGQIVSGYNFRASWLDYVNYYPYFPGLTARIHVGVGLAF